MFFFFFAAFYRTSNAERIYQEELAAALDESRENIELHSDGDGDDVTENNYDDVTEKSRDDVINEIITINESDEERVMKIVSCKKTGGKYKD